MKTDFPSCSPKYGMELYDKWDDEVSGNDTIPLHDETADGIGMNDTTIPLIGLMMCLTSCLTSRDILRDLFKRQIHSTQIVINHLLKTPQQWKQEVPRDSPASQQTIAIT